MKKRMKERGEYDTTDLSPRELGRGRGTVMKKRMREKGEYDTPDLPPREWGRGIEGFTAFQVTVQLCTCRRPNNSIAPQCFRLVCLQVLYKVTFCIFSPSYM